jgi:Arc/MetJ-type ribon-helix-helix transcriptional regulator
MGVMGVIQVQLPDDLQVLIDRQVAAGRVANEAEFLVEAAFRYAEDLAVEDEIVAEAQAGIADAQAGRSLTVASPQDAETSEAP